VVDGNIFDTILPTQRDGLSYYKNVMDVFSTELGIQLSFVKTSEFRRGVFEPPSPRYATDSMNEVRINIHTPYVVMRNGMECSWQHFWTKTGIIVFKINNV
jgi:hypothetical protein